MDDLLDLDWSKKPGSTSGQTSLSLLQQQQQQQGAQRGAAPSTTTSNTFSSYSFDALTRSMPNNVLANGANRSPARPTPSQPRNANQSNDAFSSLFETSQPAQQGNLTLAERLRNGQSIASSPGSSRGTSPMPPAVPSMLGVDGNSNNTTNVTDTSAWDGLDDLLGSNKRTKAVSPLGKRVKPGTLPPDSNSKIHGAPRASDNLWDFDSAGPSKAAAPPVESIRPEKQTAAPTKSNDPFDFSEFEDPGNLQSSALEGGSSSAPQRSRQIVPDSSKETHMSLHDEADAVDDEDDDDYMGALGRPQRSLASREERPPPADAQKAPARTGPSPPPHILGQLVEMGFGPVEARNALSQTAGGKDVSAALELLVQKGRGTAHSTSRQAHEERDREYARRLQREEEAVEKTRQAKRRHDMPPGANANVERADTPDWQKQADQLYAQASDFGNSVFKSANAFWSQAKAQAQRALDERSAGGTSGTTSGRQSPATSERPQSSRRWAVPSRERREWQGKPKWMMEETTEVHSASQANGDAGGSFKDDSEPVQQVPSFVADAVEKEPIASASPQPQTDLWTTSGRSGETKTVKGVPVERVAPPRAREQRNTAQSSKSGDKRIRNLFEDSPVAVSSSSHHRERGNDCFKRGAYADAENAYSAALDALNVKSIRRVPLLNNRAQARLKSGNATAALSDTKEVLRLIVVGLDSRASPSSLYRPSLEAPLPQTHRESVNLRDAYGKALLRRAQAEEMLEHWDISHSVWSLLDRFEKEEGSGRSGVGNMRLAKDGKARCSKMLTASHDANTTGTARAPPPRQATAAAVSAMAKAEQAAKERIRADNAAAAAEASAKDALRDSVDARILMWKQGKEANVRALLASLENVVWPGLGWKKVGMHELVMDNQVKKVYMRAIGKLHPDKLTPRNNTVEERMLGGSAFAVLNEAYAQAQGQ